MRGVYAMEVGSSPSAALGWGVLLLLGASHVCCADPPTMPYAVCSRLSNVRHVRSLGMLLLEQPGGPLKAV
jgi:hypothetical protein